MAVWFTKEGGCDVFFPRFTRHGGRERHTNSLPKAEHTAVPHVRLDTLN
jgi:hypothetical protein